MKTATAHEAQLAAIRKRRSQSNRGEALEQLLDLVHARYQRQGLAYVQRNGVPFVPARRAPGYKGPPLGTVGPEAPPDYLALTHGQPVLFDAKSTVGATWGFSGLEKHQARALDDWQANGGTAGLVVAVDRLATIGWVPWGTFGARWWAWWNLPTRAKAGEASLTAAEVGVWPCPGGDWLPAARFFLTRSQ